MTGDDQGSGELVLRRQALVRNLIRRLGGEWTRADDLAQLVFLQARKAMRGLRAPDGFGPWLRTIAVNVWLEDARRRVLDVDPALDGLADESSGPNAPETRIDLQRALAQLRPAERLCVVLSYAEGLTHAEIAETVGINLG